jgi:glyoxylase-like metal-dependent hydrolase (beta-lactamase superfamily II)
MMRARVTCLAASCALAVSAPAFAQTADVQDLGYGIYRAAGVMGGTAVRVPQSNTFMIVTRDGNVIVDTSIAAVAPAHQRALTAVNAGPIKAIVLTHAHGDHTGGVAQWRQPGTEIIAQRKHDEFIQYQRRLAGYFARSRDAILYVHDATVKGMNEGKSAHAGDHAAARARRRRVVRQADVVGPRDLRRLRRLVRRQCVDDVRAVEPGVRRGREAGGRTGCGGWLAAGIRDAEARLK